MKTKKILICFAALTVLTLPVFAGPPPRSCCRPYCPPPPPHWHHHHRHCGSSGVRLAADIVSLVGASLNVFRGPVAVPVAAVPAPAAAVPVAVQPAVQPYYYPPTVPDYRRYNNGYVPMPPIYR